MSLRDLKSKLGFYNGGRPDDFELGPQSTLHNVSSTYGQPPFSSYKSAFLKTKVPTNPVFLFPQNPKKYLDNPPK
jgi:hypothetical protein